MVQHHLHAPVPVPAPAQVDGGNAAFCSLGVSLKALWRYGMHGNVRVFTSDETLPWPRQFHVVEAGDGAFTAPAANPSADYSSGAICCTEPGAAAIKTHLRFNLLHKCGFESNAASQCCIICYCFII